MIPNLFSITCGRIDAEQNKASKLGWLKIKRRYEQNLFVCTFEVTQ